MTAGSLLLAVPPSLPPRTFRTGPEEPQERETAPGRAGTSPDTRWEDAWNLPDGRQVRVHLDGDHDWMHSGAPSQEMAAAAPILPTRRPARSE